MRRIILLLAIVFLLSAEAFAFRSAGIGFGPAFNIRGGFSTNYMITGEWSLHKNIGGRLFVGFINGFWIGTALNTSFSVYETKYRKFDWSINFSVPFIINMNSGVKTAFIGLSFGNSLSFSLDSRHSYYIFITPVEFVFIPVTWGLSPSRGFAKGFDISLMCSTGFRVGL